MEAIEWIAALLFWLLGLFLMWKIPLLRGDELRRMDSSAALDASSLSVIIPARNEAHNITSLLGSLDRQTFPLHEIIVVDDGSSDATAVVAEQMGATVLTGQALPDGWCGLTEVQV